MPYREGVIAKRNPRVRKETQSIIDMKRMKSSKRDHENIKEKSDSKGKDQERNKEKSKQNSKAMSMIIIKIRTRTDVHR